MGSEAIVVLVLIAVAIGFVIWVRMNSHDHDPVGQAGTLGEECEHTRERK